MFCPKCGQPINDTDRFCPKCGNSFLKTDIKSEIPENSGKQKRNSYLIAIVGAIIGLILAVFIAAGLGFLGDSSELLYTGRLNESNIESIGSTEKERKQKGYQASECDIYIGFTKGMKREQIESQLFSLGYKVQNASNGGAKGPFGALVRYYSSRGGNGSGNTIFIAYDKSQHLLSKSTEFWYWTRSKNITQRTYDQIQPGMTYEEIARLFGAEGFPKEVQAEMELDNSHRMPQESHFSWAYTEKNQFDNKYYMVAEVAINFREGKVAGKEWKK